MNGGKLRRPKGKDKKRLMGGQEVEIDMQSGQWAAVTAD